MNGMLDYVPGGSLIHKLNPLSKLFMSATLCVCCFLSNSHLFIAAIIALNLLLALPAGIFLRMLRAFLSLIKFSLMLFVVQVFFVRQGAVLLRLPFNIYITDEGLSFSLLFVMRLIAATMPLTMMLSVTRIGDIANVLVSKLNIPYKYAFALTTAIRFIPVFSTEMKAIMEAQTARGVEFDTRSFFKKLRLLLPLCVPLLISSVKRIDSCAISAELRGFNLRGRHSSYKQYTMTPADYAVLAACCALIIVAVTS